MFHKKQIFKLNVLKNLLNDENSCVSLVPSTRLLALPPFFLNDMKSGILHQLNTMLKKYDRSLGGIVIGYQNITVLMDDNTGIIPIGSSETEVNISVEFYIFQPKIGSYLEGVINKKSNMHIGCLVHQHFNATILKPEDVEYEDWNCKNLNIDDKIIFKVKDLDFTTLLPYIEGIFDGENFLNKIKLKSNQNCDTNNVIDNDLITSQVETTVSKELLENKIKSNKCCKSDSPNNKQEKNKKNENNISNVEESDSFIDKASKKKKKKKKEKLEHSNLVEEKGNMCLPLENLENNMLCSTQLEPNLESKKMMTSFCSPIPHSSSSKSNMNIRNFNLECSVNLSNQNDIDEKPVKVKSPQEKQKREERESSEDTTSLKKRKREERESSEDTTSLKKRKREERESSEDTTSLKKRKREERESSEDTTSLKKLKTAYSLCVEKEGTKGEINGNEVKSLLKNMIEEMFSEQLNRVREELNMSSFDKESCKEGKKKHKKKKKELDNMLSENEKFEISENDPKSMAQNMLDELCKLQMQRVKEELNISDNEGVEESKKKKLKENRNENEAMKDETEDDSNNVVDEKTKGKKRLSLSEAESLTESKKKKVKKKNEEETKDTFVNGGDKNPEVQDTLDKLYRSQLQRIKEELNISDRESIKESRKNKTKVKKSENEVSIEKTKTEFINLDDEKSEQNKTEVLSKLQLQSIGHELNMLDKKTFKETKKKKAKIKKNEIEVSIEKTKDENSNESDKNSEIQDSVDKLCRLQLQRVKEELSMSDRDSIKEIKKKKTKKKTGDSEDVKEKTKNVSINVNTGNSKENTMEKVFSLQLQRVENELSMSDRESLRNNNKIKVKVRNHEASKQKTKENSMEGNKSEAQSTLDELCKLQLQKVKEELSVSDRENLKETKKKKVKEKKHENETSKEKLKNKSLKPKVNTQDNSTNESETSNKKSTSRDLYQQVINRTKNKSVNIREKKKKKLASEKQEAPVDETNDSLYYELLKKAKNAIDLG